MPIHSWFYQADIHQGPLLHGHHHHSLMLLSVLVAIAASWLALQVAGLARRAVTPATRRGAVLSGAAALGGGIWAMHFIGMLSFTLPLQVHYDITITLLSMLPAMGASLIALQLLSRRLLGARELLIGGTLIGAGIGTMHYVGMTAMRMDAQLLFDPWWFAGSVVVAVVLAILALWVRFGLGRPTAKTLLVAAVVMGLAIATMHYTGMAAVRIIGTPETGYIAQFEQQRKLGLLIAFATLMMGILVGAVNGAVRFSQLYQKIQASEEHIRGIVDTAVDGIISWDRHGRIQEVNHAAERMFGWPEADLIGQNLDMLLPLSTRERLRTFLNEFSAGRHPHQLGTSTESWCLRRNGERFPVRVSIGQAHIRGNTRFVGFVSDITERRQLEDSLQQSEAQYRGLITNIPGASFRCLPRQGWHMLFISDAVEQLCGWPAEIFISGEKSFADLIHPADSAHTHDVVMAAIERREQYSLEYRILHRNGQLRWISESASAILNSAGEPEWIDGVMIDVTENKLRNAEFEGIVRAISLAQGMLDLDMDGRIRFANPHFVALSGRTAEQLENLYFQQLLDEGGFTEQLWSEVQRGNHLSGEYTLPHSDGSSVYVQIYCNPIIDSLGNPAKVIVLVTDLSERRRMEVALLEAKERAELAAESKGAFLANMSHEIRTPMNAIIGFSEVLLNDNLTCSQRKYARTVNQSARSLLGLLNDILDTAKLEKGQVRLERQDFSLRELCQQQINIFSLEANRKELRLEFSYELPQEHFSGDPTRVRQVLTNLLGNALKFTEHGRVVLTVDQYQRQVRLRISDTGIGIDNERLQQIFEPFAQADASMSRRFGGTGLGTTIARQLVELMGGQISVESTLHQGSTFQVLLPLTAASADAKALTALPGNRIELPPLRILVADDVADNVQLMELMLHSEGHRVRSVENGLRAFELVVEEPFDLILMDMQMPEVDGLEASRIIRRYEANLGRRPTPIIALTASVLDKDRQAAREAGMEGFASKPVDRVALRQEMARVLGLQMSNGDADKTAPAQPPQLIDWSGGERRWGDRNALELAIYRFLGELPSQLAELDEALDKQALEHARQLAHRLNGSAGNLSLQALRQLASTLESKLAAGQNDTAELREALHACFLATRQAAPVPSTLNSATTSAAETIDAQERDALIENLITVLLRGEVNEQALQRLTSSLPTEQRKALEQALDDFEFATAIALLEAELSTAPTQG
ncbi:PAS domain S-box protein [Halopseudomonas maritima]|uniref:PAS domain S-box protein n=1 Tax=Halopseudomonas maritima TaxID=2918528 RepID=UPI001EEBEB97|nr:PAS domain S-box protein [Halopseudomonas maritima]UJJ33218.1 PAS domain S-box protein [Halopseudomonas maritima]